MCGITGFIDYNSSLDKAILGKMANTMHHRGPDSGGAEVYEQNNYVLGLAHRRLSIIDLSNAAIQPMHLKHLHIVFNGEIYNYKEIRKELENKNNRKFVTNSDTEVILHAFDEWGAKAVDKFIGMFAFAIYNERDHKLYLFRDRAGVKPLYYYSYNNLFLFSSEIKAFHVVQNFNKTINTAAVNEYMKFGYVPEPDSIYEQVKKLQAGHYLEMDCTTSQIKLHKYWDVLTYYQKPKLTISYNDAMEEVEKLLVSACMYRMVSDVPVGVFLSGGYDSTLVSALIQANSTQKIKTFSIGFKDKKFDESVFAKQVAQHIGTEHYEAICSEKEAQDLIPELPFYYDEPFGDSSAIPTMMVSRLARKYVTVALSADAGDEVFGGYERYTLALKIAGIKNKVPSFMRAPLGIMGKMMPLDSLKMQFKGKPLSKSTLDKYLNLFTQNLSAHEFMVMSNHSTGYNDILLSPDVRYKSSSYQHNFAAVVEALSSNDEIDKMLAIDYKTYMLEDILTKVDRAGMSVSLEGREPLLDHRIIEYVAQLPSNYKIRNGNKKAILKDIVHKYVPKHIMDRPKMGFAIPVQDWMRTSLAPVFNEMLSDEKLNSIGLFNTKGIKKLKKDYFSGDNTHFTALWYLFNYMMWNEKWN